MSSVFDACVVDANVEHILKRVAGEARARDETNHKDTSATAVGQLPTKCMHVWSVCYAG